MATLRELVAKNLDYYLEKKGLSQTELAKLLKVSFQTVNSYMNGRSGISSDMLAKMANVLGIEESDLIAIPQKPPEKVELNKDQWETIANQLRLVSSNKLPLPTDIQDGLSALDDKSREVAWTMIRAVLAGLKEPRKKGQSEVG